ncbi:hypothetical protein [Bradyrhizobium guangdongense]
MDRRIIFKCPQTGMNVQHWLTEADGNDYQPVTCAACTRVHFINKETGKVMGQKG